MKQLTRLMAILALAFSGGMALAQAPEEERSTMDVLLDLVRQGQIANAAENARREREFLANKTQQQTRVNEATAERQREEAISAQLEATYNANEQRIQDKLKTLDNRLGPLRELFGIMQQVASDAQGIVQSSIVSAEYPGRHTWLEEFARNMGKSTKLPGIPDMERLWYEMQREMTESGKVTRFTTTIITLDGEELEQEVVRVGSYNLVSDGEYVAYDSDTGTVQELPRQPAGRFVSSADDLQDADPGDGFTAFGLDPTRGQLLALQVQVPTIGERIQQGGTPGYIIILLGIIGLLLAGERYMTLSRVGAKVEDQAQNPGKPDKDNPLGRVLEQYHENKSVDSETLQLKLDEAILREQPAINARIAFIRIISMVAPLLGLLGTVIGMIVTFQAITLFGTGDPKTMAGGISQALITTVLGLTVAIPTVLLHSIVHTKATDILHVLTEQSAGLVAEHAEGKRGR